MALIKCPECGNDISDKVASCTKCGYPINVQNSEVIANEPHIVTLAENAEQKSNKRFFTSMILNAIATGILVFIKLVLILNPSETTIEHISSLRDFLLVYPIATIIILIIAFAFSLLTYLIKNRKKNIFAIGSAFFSIIGCLLCFVLSTEYLCELIIVLPSGILYFISALITVFGLKECFIMLNKEEKAECFRISRIILYTTTFIVYLYGRFFYNIDTLCNHGYTCSLCGLRKAMYYIEHGRFIDAINSNKFCVLVFAFFLIAVIDIVYMCICYAKTNKR